MKRIIFGLMALTIGCSGSKNNPPPSPSPSTGGVAAEAAVPDNGTDSNVSEVVEFNVPQAQLEDPYKPLRDQYALQLKIVSAEREALNQALARRDNHVNLSKDFLDVLAYGVSTGALTYDFVKGTNAAANVKSFFTTKKIPTLVPPETPVQSAFEASVVATTPEKASLMNRIGMAAFRTTEIVSAAVLGVFFIGDVNTLGQDISIAFDDTQEVYKHKARLDEAEKNLKIADKNFQAAMKAQQVK